MKKVLLLFFLLLFSFACDDTTNTTEVTFMNEPVGLLYSQPVSDYTYIVDNNLRRILLFSLKDNILEDIKSTPGMSGIPFIPDGEWIAGAVSPVNNLLSADIFRIEAVEEVVLYDLREYPYNNEIEPSVTKEFDDVISIIGIGEEWGLLFNDRLEMWSSRFENMSMSITFPTVYYWDGIKFFGNSVYLINKYEKYLLKIDINTLSIIKITLDIVPSDITLQDNLIWVIGGEKIELFDLTGNFIKEKKLFQIMDYLSYGDGSVGGAEKKSFVAMESTLGYFYFIDSNLCYISTGTPEVYDDFFYDTGVPSNPKLVVDNFSQCLGDVRNTTYILQYQPIITNSDTIIDSIYKDKCLKNMNEDFIADNIIPGDILYINDDNVYYNFTVTAVSENTLCSEKKLDNSFVNDSFYVRAKNFVLFEKYVGYVTRVIVDSKSSLGYMDILIQSGNNKVSTGDYFIFHTKSGVTGINFSAGKIYTNGYTVASYPFGFFVDYQRNNLFALFGNPNLAGNVSIENKTLIKSFK